MRRRERDLALLMSSWYWCKLDKFFKLQEKVKVKTFVCEEYFNGKHHQNFEVLDFGSQNYLCGLVHKRTPSAFLDYNQYGGNSLVTKSHHSHFWHIPTMVGFCHVGNLLGK